MMVTSITDTTFYLTGLTPGTNFTISIMPYIGVSSGKPSNESITTAPNSKC